MIELFEETLQEFDRHSSKGNQLKWEVNGVWYKADYTGYEGLSEYVISKLLQKSSLKENEFVLYEPEQIKYKRRYLNGVKSIDFLEKGWQIITVERLYQTMKNRSLMKDIWSFSKNEKRAEYFVNQVEQMTGLKKFGAYLCKMLTVDAFFLNEDRHMHNIAVLMNDKGEYDYCPIFDQGAGLMADTTLDYPMEVDFHELLNDVKAKTICESFDDALDIVEKLYGYHLTFHFTKKDVEAVLEDCAIYPKEETERVKNILFYQMRKYQYMF